MANSQEELELLAKNNLKAIFCNHNCFIDESIYKPISLDKRFDTVYDARLSAFKRHELTSEISSLALITYIHDLSHENEYTSTTKKLLKHAHWFNHTTDGLCHLNDKEVNDAINQCHVGLCLSEVEGAMYASIQYLLAGLPVVNVPNKGGRDLFFDDYNSITVEPDAQKVADAVKEMIVRNPDPNIIRKETIKRIKIHRGYFIDLVNDIYIKEGVDRDFKNEWDNVFYNKFIRWVSYREVL